MHRSQYNVQLLETGDTKIEYAIWKLNYETKLVHILGIYHLPPNNINDTTNVMFKDHLMDLLTEKIHKQQNTIILEDFNMHFENLTETDTIIFSDTMQALDFKQHVKQTNTQTRQYTRLNIHRTNIRNSSHNLCISPITV